MAVTPAVAPREAHIVPPDTPLVFDLEEYAPGCVQLNPPDPLIRERITPEEYRRQLDLTEYYVRRTYSPMDQRVTVHSRN